VYKQDVLIGYEHASLLYKHPDTNRLKVDHNLAHDVIMQRGGGGEPFLLPEEPEKASIPLSKRLAANNMKDEIAPDIEEGKRTSARTINIQKSVRSFDIS